MVTKVNVLTPLLLSQVLFPAQTAVVPELLDETRGKRGILAAFGFDRDRRREWPNLLYHEPVASIRWRLRHGVISSINIFSDGHMVENFDRGLSMIRFDLPQPLSPTDYRIYFKGLPPSSPPSKVEDALLVMFLSESGRESRVYDRRNAPRQLVEFAKYALRLNSSGTPGWLPIPVNSWNGLVSSLPESADLNPPSFTQRWGSYASVNASRAMSNET